MTLEYAELHCLSCFSFLRGASHPEELVRRASELGYRALALTDECSVAGVVRAWEACRDTGLELIVGSEFRLQDERVLLLAQNRRGYAQLCALITLARRRAPKGEYRIEWADFGPQPDCLLLYRPGDNVQRATERGRELSGRFPGRCWLLIERLLGGGDAARYARQQQLAKVLMLPMVCASGVLMHLPARQRLQDVLTSIRLGVPVNQAGFALQGNAERHLRSLNKLQRLYTPEMMRETLRIAERCCFDLGELRYEYPAELVPQGKSAGQWLALRVQEGAGLRFPEGMPAAIARQVEHELGLIAELQYEHYFLTIEDIVRFARSQGILCQGRGSAANSVVCYCLHITEVDPRQVNMLFERFISRERDEPPDIDVDFEHERREEVIQYIYRRYGRERAGIAATVIRYRRRSALRDVGKALGLDAAYLHGLCSRLDRRAELPQWLEQLRACGGDVPAPRFRLLLELVDEIIGFPRHLSQHVGGFVISAGPLSELVPVENAAMKERSLIQWNKDDLESLGLLKVDVLALGMLSAVRKTLALLSQRDGKVLRMQDIPREDPAVYEMLSRAQSVGVFQVESRAQMNMLPRLQPRCYYDLVIQVAIVRPGPIQGDMVHPYLKRRAGLEPVHYPGDAVRQVLERTLGVPIFQEQVISLAMVAAGFSAGEADQLRRAMAAWRRSGTIAVYQRRLVEGMLARGYSEEFAQRICRQIEGFGEYGFPESHAASFALLVYVSAWLKCHEPAAFCCGLLNSQPMGFYSPAQLVQDARRQGVTVRAVDINCSAWDATLEPDGALRLGFRMVKRLSRKAAEFVLEARKTGPFSSVADAIGRIRLDTGSWDLLAAAGALNTLAQHRYQARWALLAGDPALALGDARVEESGVVQLAAPNERADLEEDFRHLGLTLGRHPMALLRDADELQGCLSAEQLERCRPGQLVRVAGVVTNRQRPGSASGVTFVTLEDETGQVNLVVWGRTAEVQRRALLSARLLRVAGVLEREGDIIHVVAGRLEDISRCWQTLSLRSRDFH
ncbi:error-prone DNA polymerase [Marinobacterium rhizophilum]|uniref:Error-prone DNA polymerase n=1 Tax=Marinobacterium rhizophilum TaxID=420402 RepID=A0ABY5HRM8_9GAMM|nr:error-prone DNA polymerase [Marinobacterium rhizophilum]